MSNKVDAVAVPRLPAPAYRSPAVAVAAGLGLVLTVATVATPLLATNLSSHAALGGYAIFPALASTSPGLLCAIGAIGLAITIGLVIAAVAGYTTRERNRWQQECFAYLSSVEGVMHQQPELELTSRPAGDQHVSGTWSYWWNPDQRDWKVTLKNTVSDTTTSYQFHLDCTLLKDGSLQVSLKGTTCSTSDPYMSESSDELWLSTQERETFTTTLSGDSANYSTALHQFLTTTAIPMYKRHAHLAQQFTACCRDFGTKPTNLGSDKGVTLRKRLAIGGLLRVASSVPRTTPDQISKEFIPPVGQFQGVQFVISQSASKLSEFTMTFTPPGKIPKTKIIKIDMQADKGSRQGAWMEIINALAQYA